MPPRYNEPAELGPDEQLESDAEESDTFVDPEGCCGLSWQVPRKVFKPLYGPDVRALIKRQIEAGLLEPTEENDFSEYILIILQDIKNTLKEDAYFIGFLAAVSKYQSWGQVLHAAFIIFILILAIACQGSMIWFMRWGQLLQSNSNPTPFRLGMIHTSFWTAQRWRCFKRSQLLDIVLGIIWDCAYFLHAGRRGGTRAYLFEGPEQLGVSVSFLSEVCQSCYAYSLEDSWNSHSVLLIGQSGARLELYSFDVFIQYAEKFGLEK